MLLFMPGWIMLRKYLPVRRTFSVRCRTSIDIVTMRNADRLSEYDREDMKLVREGYGTKSALLYRLHG